jgi:hypothetical protein
MADSFDSNSIDREKKADAPEVPRPGVPQRKPGSLLTSAILFLLDVALTLFLFITPFVSGGAYWNFVMPEFVFGVLYVIIRIILKIVKQTHITDMCFIALRIVGITVAVIYYVVFFSFGNWFSWFYPVRRYLYVNGNYSDASQFEFLPDRIPDRADRFYMDFVPSVEAKMPSIDIHFYTDSAGTERMRKEALSKDLVLIAADSEEYFEERREVLMRSGPGQPDELYSAEIYRKSGKDGSPIVYLIYEETGYCRVYWHG